ncbi:hypothetical protein ACH33_00430 [Aneurinibacillus sp. XH2]|nr:hypothetical protein ACH33_00430 [Aneurinibacillus sp. XH2]
MYNKDKKVAKRLPFLIDKCEKLMGPVRLSFFAANLYGSNKGCCLRLRLTAAKFFIVFYKIARFHNVSRETLCRK